MCNFYDYFSVEWVIQGKLLAESWLGMLTTACLLSNTDTTMELFQKLNCVLSKLMLSHKGHLAAFVIIVSLLEDILCKMVFLNLVPFRPWEVLFIFLEYAKTILCK